MLVVGALSCSGAESKDTPVPRGGVARESDAAVPAPAGALDAGRTAPSNGAGVAERNGARARVLIVGTSLTAGLGLDPSQAYPALLQRMADSAGLRVEIINAGLSGETSAGALRRIDWLLNDPAPVVMLETGANDGLRGLDPDSTAANIRAILAKIRERAPGTTILLAQMEAPPNLGESYTRRFHALFPRVAREAGATLVPFLLDSVAGVAKLNQPDGIHPTADGAKIVARQVWRTMGPRIARLDQARQGG